MTTGAHAWGSAGLATRWRGGDTYNHRHPRHSGSALSDGPLMGHGAALKESMRVVLILAACALAGCMQLPQAPQTTQTGKPTPRTVPELLALKTADFQSPQNAAAGEQALREAQLQAARATLALPPGPELDARLPAALEAVALFNTEKPKAREQLMAALPALAQKPPAYQRSVLSFAHTLFWNDAAPLIKPLLPALTTPREFAIAAYTVLRAEPQVEMRQALRDQLLKSFPDWQMEPRLRALERRLWVGVAGDLAQRPPLVDLLAAPLRPGYPVVYSFQRANRERTGLALVRGADGRFVRNADGSYFSIAQLALARTNLPGTITNGNTPQGLFAVRGTGTAQTNPWIGPTPYLESLLPREGSVAEFEHADVAGEWSDERYAAFLPASWRGYFPIWETYLAGQAGRDEILLHGNAINPAYYQGELFYPAPPQAGCMIAMEYWSKDDGSLLYSDQLALLKAFASTGRDQGYVLVVELDDQQRPVVMADVVDAVRAAERKVAP